MWIRIARAWGWGCGGVGIVMCNAVVEVVEGMEGRYLMVFVWV